MTGENGGRKKGGNNKKPDPISKSIARTGTGKGNGKRSQGRGRGKHKQDEIEVSYRAKPLDPSIDLWLQQPKESNPAYEAFVTYRDMGRDERTIRGAAKLLGKDRTGLEKWSAEWSWGLRCRAWDMNLDKEVARRQFDDIVEMRRRHARRAQILQRALIEPATAIVNELQEDPMLIRNMIRAPDGGIILGRLGELMGLVIAAARLYPDAVTAERIAMGEPSDIHELRQGSSAQSKAVAEEILGDPESRALALRLYERIHGLG